MGTMDILPAVTIENSDNEQLDTDNMQWTQLPNVVNESVKINNKNDQISAVNDTFLLNIAKEIELLDEELSSMGILTENDKNKNDETVHSSDIEHNEEEKMEILKQSNTTSSNENEEEIIIIKDQLTLLRKSLIFKKQKQPKIKCNKSNTENPENEEAELHNFVEFISERHKDAYFDPLVSPLKIYKVSKKEYNAPIHHEQATKIQKQWKKFRLKGLLVTTFNRHLLQSQTNKLPVTISDLIASTTHEIVGHAEMLFSAVHNQSSANNESNALLNTT